MEVKLLYSTNVDNLLKSGFINIDIELNKHINYTFFISGISRALLQELVRHKDNISLSVKSTRYTLKELKSEERFDIEDFERASKYLVMTDNKMVNKASIETLNNLRDILLDGISNDKAKYALPENYKTELTWTINKESLIHFLKLRSSKSALWEIQEFSKIVKDVVDI